jgi:Flp pilus assembly protein TadD
MKSVVVKSLRVWPGLALFLAGPVPALAQPGAIVQQTPPAMAVERLNQNLTRLSRQPTDMDALIGAGMAAYDLGDAQAANGFFMRADMVNPRNGRVKLGLALVALQLKQPREAADYFDQAAQFGEPATAYLGERALAYDLVGQQDKAQRDYVQALRMKPTDHDLIRDYAVSLGISGKVDEAEAQLHPLLYQSDRAAWRDRTMILAMNGRVPEARRIAQSVMPRTLADSMDPYFQRMGGLTPAQKAVATHYGQFPAEGIRMAPVTSPQPVQTATRTETKRRKKGRGNEDVAPPMSAEERQLAAAMPRGDMPPPAMVQPNPAAIPHSPVHTTPRGGRNDGSDDDPDGWTRAEQATQPSQTRTAATSRKRSTLPMVQPLPQSYASPAAPQSVAPAAPVQTVQTVQATPAPRWVSQGAEPSAPSSSQPASPVQVQPVKPVQPLPTGPAMPVQPVQPTIPAPHSNTPAGPLQTPTPMGQPRPSQPAPWQPLPTQPAPSSTPVVPATPQPVFTATATPASTAPAVHPRSLADIMAQIEVPDAERQSTAPAVDLNEVARMKAKAAADKAKKEAAAKAKAEADAKAKAEAEEKARLKANPSRYWVQVAAGRDVDALGFDIRRLRKTYTSLASLDAWSAEWGATRRLLVGPFVTPAKARAVESDLHKAGSDGFVWQSDAGEVISPLGKK